MGVARFESVVRLREAGVAELADAQDLNPAIGNDRTERFSPRHRQRLKEAPLAQLDRVPDYESGG